MKKIIDEFKDFMMKGNMLDLAVGVVVGGAFGGIVNSLVNDIIMPPIGLLLGNVNFSDLFVQLNKGKVSIPDGTTLEAAKELGAVTWNYGNFISVIINFVIIALAIFLVVRMINKIRAHAEELALKKAEETPAEPTEKECPYCYTSIPLKATRCPNCTSKLEE